MKDRLVVFVGGTRRSVLTESFNESLKELQLFRIQVCSDSHRAGVRADECGRYVVVMVFYATELLTDLKHQDQTERNGA